MTDQEKFEYIPKKNSINWHYLVWNHQTLLDRHQTLHHITFKSIGKYSNFVEMKLPFRILSKVPLVIGFCIVILPCCSAMSYYYTPHNSYGAPYTSYETRFPPRTNQQNTYTNPVAPCPDGFFQRLVSLFCVFSVILKVLCNFTQIRSCAVEWACQYSWIIFYATECAFLLRWMEKKGWKLKGIWNVAISATRSSFVWQWLLRFNLHRSILHYL